MSEQAEVAEATVHPIHQSAHEAAVAAGHPSTFKPKGQEVTIFLDDEEADILIRSAAIGRNIRCYDVDEEALGFLVHTALRLGVKELDNVARSAITSAYHRAAIRPIREDF